MKGSRYWGLAQSACQVVSQCLIWLTAVITVVACGFQKTGAGGDREESSLTVTGGRSVGANSTLPTRRSTVALTRRDLAERGRAYCTATLVHPVIVLTAAHCVTDEWGKSLPLAYVAYGTKVTADPLLLNKMVGVAVHKGWRGDLSEDEVSDHDLALVRMSAAFRGAQPIKLYRDNKPPEKVVIAGYGVSQGRSEDDSGLLRFASMKIISLDPHKMIMSVLGYPREGYALYPRGFGDYARKRVRSGACAGDSGGPAFARFPVQNRDSGPNSLASSAADEWFLLGVTSFGWEYEVEGRDPGQQYCIGKNGYVYLPYYKKQLEAAILQLAQAEVSENSHQFVFSEQGFESKK